MVRKSDKASVLLGRIKIESKFELREEHSAEVSYHNSGRPQRKKSAKVGITSNGELPSHSNSAAADKRRTSKRGLPSGSNSAAADLRSSNEELPSGSNSAAANGRTSNDGQASGSSSAVVARRGTSNTTQSLFWWDNSNPNSAEEAWNEFDETSNDGQASDSNAAVVAENSTDRQAAGSNSMSLNVAVDWEITLV